MQPTNRQPHADPISDDLLSTVLADTLGERGVGEYDVRRHGEFSNDLAVVTLSSGRRLMVKRGRHPWSGDRFANARRASSLLRSGAGIIAPEPLELRDELAEAPVEAYWRIELPLFADLWKDLGGKDRQGAMRSLGRLMRRAHAAGSQPGTAESRAALDPFSAADLERDLCERLRPAVAGEWPAAAEMLEKLVRLVPSLGPQLAADPVVLHGDLHLGNVLCRVDGAEVRCVGLLDLEWVHSGPAESDFARFRVMHAGPFDMAIEPHALEWVFEGYDRALDRCLLRFYELYHYINLGLYSAVIGDEWHADAVATAAGEVAETL